MLRSIKDLIHYRIEASDGDIGTAHDFYFDDHSWAVRYLVVQTGSWFHRDRTLVSPVEIEKSVWSSRHMLVNLTREAIRNGPDVDTDKPISRRKERDMAHHYRWPMYWGAPGMIGPPVVPPSGAVAMHEKEAKLEDEHADPNLRSVNEVLGYKIRASDGRIGHVEDFIVDAGAWVIRYLVVETRDLLPGRKVLIAPQWIQDIDWGERKVTLNLDRESVRNSPEFDPSLPVNKVQEEILYDFYGRPYYWS